MQDLQKAGGIAAVIEALAYLAGFVLFLFFMDSSSYIGPVRRVAFLVDNQAALYLGMLITYVVTGIALVVLAIALHARLQGGAPALMQIATAFGILWAGVILASGMIAIVGMDTVATLYATDPERAASIWLAIGIVQDGLGGGIEIIGGIWVLLVSWAAQRSKSLPAPLNILGGITGVAGILTVVPALKDLADLFGLAQIVWFGGIGIVMLRVGQRSSAPAPART